MTRRLGGTRRLRAGRRRRSSGLEPRGTGEARLDSDRAQQEADVPTSDFNMGAPFALLKPRDADREESHSKAYRTTGTLSANDTRIVQPSLQGVDAA